MTNSRQRRLIKNIATAVFTLSLGVASSLIGNVLSIIGNALASGVAGIIFCFVVATLARAFLDYRWPESHSQYPESRSQFTEDRDAANGVGNDDLLQEAPGAAFPPDLPLSDEAPSERMQIRAKSALTAVALIGLLLIGRLLDIQGRQHTYLSDLARAQHAEVFLMQGTRGMIRSRNGGILAYSDQRGAIEVFPSAISDRQTTVQQLASILSIPEAAVSSLISRPLAGIRIARNVPTSTLERVRDLNLQGVVVVLDGPAHRIYPEGRVAAATVGFIDRTGTGKAGIEKRYDGLLKGALRKVEVEVDLYGHPIRDARTWVLVAGRNPKSLQLSIDIDLQAQVERILYAAVSSTSARGGVVVVVRPSSGEVAALATLPDFDPGSPTASSNKNIQNRALSSLFQPGDLITPIVIAAGLDSGQAVANKNPPPIRDGASRAYGRERSQGDEASGRYAEAHFIAANLGSVGFRDALRRFGFGTATGIDLPDEQSGLVPPPGKWSTASLTEYSHGHGLLVTPLQLVDAYSAIAGSGELLQPHIVDRVNTTVHNERGRARTITQRACSTSAARLVRSYISSVVRSIPGLPARTAKMKWSAVSGGDASAPAVVGLVPSDNPRFVIFVGLELPASDGLSSAWHALSRIADTALAEPIPSNVAY